MRALAEGILSQTLAGLETLRDCVERCPPGEWEGRHGDYPFCQVVFHALFDCDLVLSTGPEDLKGQAFHQSHRSLFGGYEELEGEPLALMPAKAELLAYLGHCAEKARAVLVAAGDEELLAPKADYYGTMTRCERSINGIRHLQHHAAQLGFRLQLLSGEEMPWVGRGDEA